jgi:N6-L-threonylcarbamoyladenine synthase
MQKQKTFLAIETSCDETSLALFTVDETLPESPHFSVINHTTFSQIDLHAAYGGVFPALAKREHAKRLPLMCEKILKDAQFLGEAQKLGVFPKNLLPFVEKNTDLKEEILKHILIYQNLEKPISGIIVTTGPGLAPALWVGVSFAQILATYFNIPLIPANHMEGHMYSVFANQKNFTISPSEFPILSLLISGGHTEFILSEKPGIYKKIGKTRDDAVGEAFDKVARLLGLSYPGGKKVSIWAQKMREELKKDNTENPIYFTRPMLHDRSCDMSFSGLKTAVRYFIESVQKERELTEKDIGQISLAFEDAVTEILIRKTRYAFFKYPISTFIIAGGVSANTHIRKEFEIYIKKEFSNTKLHIPEIDLAGDNALMIGLAGYFQSIKTEYRYPEISDVRAISGWSIEEI